MAEYSDENNHEAIQLSNREIFTKIWTSPRSVMKSTNENRYNDLTTILLIFAGINGSFNRAENTNMGDHMSLFSVLAICIIGGAVFGWISFYIYSALLSWTGKWLKGKGNTGSLLRMVSYTTIPSLVALCMIVLRITLFGNQEFQKHVDIFDNGILSGIVYGFSLLIEIGMGIWTIVILVTGISEVQKLPIGKSILNMILPVLLLCAILIPIGAIAFIAGDFMK